jgi:hypothetical protein
MPTITIQAADTTQTNYLLAYAQKENLKFEIFESKFDDTYLSREKLYAKIDRGIEEYKRGETKKLDVNNINSFLGL